MEAEVGSKAKVYWTQITAVASVMHMQVSVFVCWDVKWLDSKTVSASGPQLELVDCLFQNIKTHLCYLYMHISTRKQVMSRCLMHGV